MSKDHFYFNRNDRIVALILLAVIITVNIVCNPWNRPSSETEPETDSFSHIPDTVRRTVYIRDTVRRNWYVRDTVVVKSNYMEKDTTKTVRHISKTAPDSPLDLNALDSAGLVNLPGIGPVTASRIIRYREQLGGFVMVTQLSEINGLPDSLMKWFVIGDSIQVRKIQVNASTLIELRRHPYIDFYQARAIVEFRKERGRMTGPDQLSFIEEFTDQDLIRIEPYLDFR